jgi:hypothetical protein
MESRTGMGFSFLAGEAGVPGESTILDNRSGRGNLNIHCHGGVESDDISFLAA